MTNDKIMIWFGRILIGSLWTVMIFGLTAMVGR